MTATPFRPTKTLYLATLIVLQELDRHAKRSGPRAAFVVEIPDGRAIRMQLVPKARRKAKART